MTVLEYREKTSLSEQKVFAEKLQVWLGQYTQEVYVKVMGKMEDIINNKFAIKLIDELYERTLEERKEEVDFIMYGLGCENNLKYDIHNHCLTHANSYRDVLYDMYIK